jgi:hypothetical protein
MDLEERHDGLWGTDEIDGKALEAELMQLDRAGREPRSAIEQRGHTCCLGGTHLLLAHRWSFAGRARLDAGHVQPRELLVERVAVAVGEGRDALVVLLALANDRLSVGEEPRGQTRERGFLRPRDERLASRRLPGGESGSSKPRPRWQTSGPGRQQRDRAAQRPSS